MINYMKVCIRNGKGYAMPDGIWLTFQKQCGEIVSLRDNKANRKIARQEAIGKIDRQEIITIPGHISRNEENSWLSNYFQLSRRKENCM